jgi:WAS/WASL-interacting protein
MLGHLAPLPGPLGARSPPSAPLFPRPTQQALSCPRSPPHAALSRFPPRPLLAPCAFPASTLAQPPPGPPTRRRLPQPPGRSLRRPRRARSRSRQPPSPLLSHLNAQPASPLPVGGLSAVAEIPGSIPSPRSSPLPNATASLRGGQPVWRPASAGAHPGARRPAPLRGQPPAA